MAQDRALAEATAFAIRIDVAEEITRLSSHLASPQPSPDSAHRHVLALRHRR
jgi:uncharacterized protein YicC (UPF0701 family)